MSTTKKKKQNPLRWVVDSIADEPSYIEKPMFGCLAIYLHGRLMLVLCSGSEPWNGLLIATGHEYHDSICREFESVVQHPVLKKWLYLTEASENFESAAAEIVETVRNGDQRFGVEPKERRGKTNKELTFDQRRKE